MKLRSSKGCFLALSLALGTGLCLPTANVQAAEIVKTGCQACGQKRVAPRPLPADKIDNAYSKMAQKAEKNKAQIQKQYGKIQPKDLVARAESFARVPHVLAEASPHGDAITIQDGSLWTVREKDHELVKTWGHKAALQIAPNLGFFSKLFGRVPQYKYLIINQETGKSVEANIAKGPYTQNPNTRRIRRIDRQRGEVYFTNGTLWQVSTSGACKDIFDEWKVGDYVLTGVNDSWFSFWKQDIIINVSAGEASTWLPASRMF